METDFYGKKVHPPTLFIAQAFGSFDMPVLLQGGQGTSYRAGNIVLKPSEDENRENWIACLFDSLSQDEGVRFAKPIKSAHNTWVYQGYVAWTFLDGEHVKGQYEKKLSASKKLHDLLKKIPKTPDFGKPTNSWSVADLAAWQKWEYNYDLEFMELIDQITPHLKDLNLPEQLIHGDLCGNFLLHEELPPAIIDFSPAWAPYGFAEGIMLADAIVYDNAALQELECFKKISHISHFDQFAWRGVLRRIVEQPEHIKWLNKNKSEAVKEARTFQKAIDYLKAYF